MAKKRSFGIPGALFVAMSALVLHGLPTTSTRTSLAAFLAMALPWPVKIFPLMPSKSFALHSLLARHRADEQRPVHAFETFVEIRGRHDAFEQRERAVIEFHAHAAKRGHRFFIGDFDEMQDDRLVRPEHRAGGDAEQE